MKTVWDEIYKKAKLLKRKPHSEINEIAELLRKNRAKRILDLGCGGGRHTVYLASKGFDVYGLDTSPVGLAYTISVLSKKKLVAHLTLHDMTQLPYDNEYFDAIISVQVIHHNTLDGIRRTIKEMTRVLKDGGIIWITMPISQNEPSSNQKEIEPGTFLPLDGIEKGLPHHYFNNAEIPSLFPNFSIIDIHNDHTNHYSLVAKKVSI